MTETLDRRKIGLLRELTNGNLGNAAFEAAVIQHLLDYYPSADIYVSCIDSLEPFKARNIKLFPATQTAARLLEARTAILTSSPDATGSAGDGSVRAWLKKRRLLAPVVVRCRRMRAKLAGLASEIMFCWHSYQFLKGFGLLIVCGGGQFSDGWGGPWGHPATLFLWSTLARLTGTRFVILDVGVERVASPLSRWLLKRVLSHAQYRSFRDERSRQIVAGWGVHAQSFVYPDLAFSLKIPVITHEEPTGPHPLVGVSPMAYCDPRSWPIKDAAVYQGYLATLASFTRELMKRGYSIVLFASQIRMDMSVIHDLRCLIVGDNPALADRIVEPTIRTVDELLAVMSTLEFVVASRMHGVLLAQLMYTPVLAISYDDKVDALMAGLDLSAFCLDIRAVALSSLIERFIALEESRSIVVDKLQKRIAEYRDSLQQQYDQVFVSQNAVLRDE